MLEIAYTICFLATGKCIDRTIPLQEYITPLGCAEKAQEQIVPELEKYAGGVRLAKWGCRRPTKGT